MWRHRFEIDPILQHSKKKARMTESPSDVKLAVALRHKNHGLAPIAFLFESYEPQYWYWECTVCIERLLLMNTNIYLISSPVLQPFVVLMIALVSVKFYSLLDPYILDSDDLFAEIKDWAIVSITISTLMLQIHEARGYGIPVGINIMLSTILLSVFGLFAYFCLTSMVTEASFFHNMAAHMFPETNKRVKRRVTQLGNFFSRHSSFLTDEGETGTVEKQLDPTGEGATGEVELQSDLACEFFEI